MTETETSGRPNQHDEAMATSLVEEEDSDSSDLSISTDQLRESLDDDEDYILTTSDMEDLSKRKTVRKRSLSWKKYSSLASLTIQNALESIALRHSRIRLPSDKLYINSTATVVVELFKLVASVWLLAKEERGLFSAFRGIYRVVRTNAIETCKVALISLIYVIQNNLLFIAASNLDVATYQALYQLKLLTTALVSAVILKRKISIGQWIALGILLLGVVLVKQADPLMHLDASSRQKEGMENDNQDSMVGLLATVIACCLSAFGGVYFEKVLKSSSSSLWLRNVQMSFLSIPLALCVSYSSDWHKIHTFGFFFGYDAFVWLTLVIRASGGMIIGMVIKYADNILKGFAISISLIFGCLANTYLFDVSLSFQFLLGTLLVSVSVLLYSWAPVSNEVRIRSPINNIC